MLRCVLGEFLEGKDLDICGKTYRDIFPLSSGPEAEDMTSKFLYAVVEILLDFINQTNDRQEKHDTLFSNL